MGKALKVRKAAAAAAVSRKAADNLNHNPKAKVKTPS
jgi:hypothetical protein